ncbi:hypothetical protein T440DRAFT_228103 [Plenodomus tracheiphilus IPT5]|uniref:Uncharacterized protein n=1 Tax=Plenodomus tracheiphilus IPT5 TaxID=1408161 RepID=A0A6A7AWM5_9PLEO|nr:hypothetical protein T440DRAFT_228103 [Plenodomus tracheiphilus IPT5]
MRKASNATACEWVASPVVSTAQCQAWRRRPAKVHLVDCQCAQPWAWRGRLESKFSSDIQPCITPHLGTPWTASPRIAGGEAATQTMASRESTAALRQTAIHRFLHMRNRPARCSTFPLSHLESATHLWHRTSCCQGAPLDSTIPASLKLLSPASNAYMTLGVGICRESRHTALMGHDSGFYCACICPCVAELRVSRTLHLPITSQR